MNKHPKPHPAGRPKGQPNSLIAKVSRSMAAAVRGATTPDLLVQHKIMIWQGHGDARLSDDGKSIVCRCMIEGGGGHRESTQEQIQWAVQMLRVDGWGMPVQTHVLEGIEREQAALDGARPAAASLSVATIVGIRKLLEQQAQERVALENARLPEGVNEGELASTGHPASTSHAPESDAIDAEYTESTE